MTPERRIAVLNHTIIRLRRRVKELEAEIYQRDTAAKAVQASAAVQKLKAIRDRLEAREPWQMPDDWWRRGGNPDTTEE